MLLQKVLNSRNISSEDKLFTDSTFFEFHDPFLMKNMSKVISRIIEHLDLKSKIVVYGDYDLDGIAGTTIFYTVLNVFSDSVSYHIPNRMEEGYGLNIESIKAIKESGCQLIITTDCGVNSKEAVAFAESVGIEVIVTDHHLPEEKKMSECLIINPKQDDCNYPFKELCGAAVAFKVAQALTMTLDGTKILVAPLIDLVTLATIADVVPLLGENRSFVKYGMNKLKKGYMRQGLRSMLNSLDIAPEKLNATRLAFSVIPKFNATGRIDSARKAVSLLYEADTKKCNELVADLLEINGRRVELQDSYLSGVYALIETGASVNVIVVENIHEGVIGIIASKVRDRTRRPTFILTRSEGDLFKASARSAESVHLFNNIIYSGADMQCETFGGHGGACGLSIRESNIPEFKRLLVETFDKIDASEFEKQEQCSIPVEVSELDTNSIHGLEILEPYGKSNSQPTFTVEVDVASVSLMGEFQTHAKVKIKGSNVEILYFNYDIELLEIIKNNERIRVTGTAGLNVFRNNVTPQIILKGVEAI